MSLSNLVDSTQREAAMLLMSVRQIALDEVRYEKQTQSTAYLESPISFQKTVWMNDIPGFEDNQTDDTPNMIHLIEASPSSKKCTAVLNSRFRTVSLCSYSDVEDLMSTSASNNVEGSEVHDKVPIESIRSSCVDAALPDQDETITSLQSVLSLSASSVYPRDEAEQESVSEASCPATGLVAETPDAVALSNHETRTVRSTTSKFVGTDIDGCKKVKDVLRKKFSWKSFPELERYLINNRVQYLQFSNQLNYTAEQKRYNNKLTQGLLDLAASEGYLFEGFTFAAVRDRIRCYYKSYVQANKKKKLKTKRNAHN